MIGITEGLVTVDQAPPKEAKKPGSAGADGGGFWRGGSKGARVNPSKVYVAACLEGVGVVFFLGLALDLEEGDRRAMSRPSYGGHHDIAYGKRRFVRGGELDMSPASELYHWHQIFLQLSLPREPRLLRSLI